ncbi:MAG TPA: hypothetical protein VLI69_01795, partial [Gammaproteobacteria bacterium]|nr:hypothetical protein [Gammaproteobacteria bacterium]
PPAALLPTPKQSSPLLPSPRVTSPVASALRPIPGQQPSALLPTPPAVSAEDYRKHRLPAAIVVMPVQRRR